MGFGDARRVAARAAHFDLERSREPSYFPGGRFSRLDKPQ